MRGILTTCSTGPHGGTFGTVGCLTLGVGGAQVGPKVAAGLPLLRFHCSAGAVTAVIQTWNIYNDILLYVPDDYIEINYEENIENNITVNLASNAGIKTLESHL